MIKPELLMPAGNLQKLEYAFSFGADAAYIGVPYYSLRARENEFGLEELQKGIALARANNKKIYVTANIFSRNRKVGPFLSQLKTWVDLKPDALIMSDPGLMLSVREEFPDFPIHLSVQANCMSWKSVKFWQQSLGVERVILSRELAVNEIKEIHERVPDIELEAFVHGSICIAYSGRCLLSSYMSYRDANQGVCDNSCREKYKVHQGPTYLEDMRTPGELYPIEEDEEGTYILNAKDLCLIEHLKELADAGVCSFKVEGRTKSVNYVALVARAYRKAIDDMAAGKPFDQETLAELKKTAHRDFHKGFFQGEPGVSGQKFDSSVHRMGTRTFAGLVQSKEQVLSAMQKVTTSIPIELLPIEARGTFKIGSTLEVQGPDMFSTQFKVTRIVNSKNQEVDTAHSGSGIYLVEGANGIPAKGIVSLLPT
jgi:putative protease